MNKKILKVIITTAILLTMYGIREYLHYDGKPSPAKLSETGAKLYLDGNYDEAITYLMKAAKQGDSQAQCFLGLCYRNGHGIQQNDSIGAEWYKKAAIQGDSTAQHNLFVYYYSQKNDSIEAIKWLMMAAEDNMSEAQYKLGAFHQFGIIVNKDSLSAIEWYMKAAEQEHVRALYRVGYCYEFSIGLPKNDSLAVEWYKKAVDKDGHEGQYALGRCYENGIGVPKNEAMAIFFYAKSAQHGNADAQFSLCKYYLEGKEVPER